MIVTLTAQGRALQEAAAAIPEKLVAGLNAEDTNAEGLQVMVAELYKIIHHLSEKQK